MEQLPAAIENMDLGKEDNALDEKGFSANTQVHNYAKISMDTNTQALEPEKDKFPEGEKGKIEFAKEATEDMVTDDIVTDDYKEPSTSRQFDNNMDDGTPRCPAGCNCSWCNAKARIRGLPGKKLHFNISKANMSKVTRNGKTGSRFQCNEANGYLDAVHGTPTPLINLRVSIKGRGKGKSNYLASIRALPDTGASVDCVSAKFVKQHGLTVQI